MATAKKLPSGNWRIRVYTGKVDGKDQFASITAPTKKQAEMEAALLKYKRHEPMTLGTAMDRYIQAKEEVLSPATVLGYKKMRRLCFNSIIGKRLDRLNQENIQQAISEYSSGHSEKSTRNASGLLSAVLKMYMPGFQYSVTLPQKSKSHITIPSHGDVQKLVDAIRGTEMETVLMLASALGLRRSEICALTWDDIDMAACTISISKAMVLADDRTWSVKSPKTTASHRTVTIPDALHKHLRGLQQTPGPIIGINPDAITKRFIRLRNKHKVNCRFHDLRHYYASLMLALGIPDKYAMQRMGHETDNMLKTVYQHLMDDKDQEVDRSINEKLNTLFK